MGISNYTATQLHTISRDKGVKGFRQRTKAENYTLLKQKGFIESQLPTPPDSGEKGAFGPSVGLQGDGSYITSSGIILKGKRAELRVRQEAALPSELRELGQWADIGLLIKRQNFLKEAGLDEDTDTESEGEEDQPRQLPDFARKALMKVATEVDEKAEAEEEARQDAEQIMVFKGIINKSRIASYIRPATPDNLEEPPIVQRVNISGRDYYVDPYHYIMYDTGTQNAVGMFDPTNNEITLVGTISDDEEEETDDEL